MRASSLHSIFIISTSLWTTVVHIGKSFALAMINRLKRQQTSAYTRSWSADLLNAPNIRRSYFQATPLKLEPKRSYMIMSNHISIYDIPLAFEALPELNIRMLTKRELAKIPGFHKALTLNEFIFVDRQDRNRAIADLKLARAKMEDGITLWVAPEGTRSQDGQLLPFKKGVFHLALETEAIIIPIGIQGADAVLPSKSLKLSVNQPVNIHIGAPIDSRQFTVNSRDALMETVRQSMLRLVGHNQ